MSYGENRLPHGEPVIQLHYGENAPIQRNINTNQYQTPSTYLGKEGPSSTSPSHGRIYLHNLIDVGIFKDTLLPNLTLHSSLAIAAWGGGRYFDYVESKDLLWSGGQLVNAWWSAVGRRVFTLGIPLGTVLGAISWPERLLLTGITLWGGHVTYRIGSRAYRRGTEEPRYDLQKREEGYWNKV